MLRLCLARTLFQKLIPIPTVAHNSDDSMHHHVEIIECLRRI